MSALLTAQQFTQRLVELPDGGRWAELVKGRVVTFQPPDPQHGTTVLNLSKALAEFLQASQTGYACFDLGLLVSQNPDTVRFPAMSYFATGSRFEHTDEVLTSARPDLVVEVPADNDRRGEMPRRVQEYFELGARLVWVADPLEKQVHAFSKQSDSQHWAETEQLRDDTVLPGFQLNLAELFGEPVWWRG